MSYQGGKNSPIGVSLKMEGKSIVSAPPFTAELSHSPGRLTEGTESRFYDIQSS